MKKLACFLAVVIISCLVTFSASAQWTAVDSLQIIPEKPTVDDTVYVVCWSVFPSGTCRMENLNMQLGFFEIYVQAQHRLGMATVICHSVDTVSLGMLPGGTHDLYYTVCDQDSANPNCDTDTLTFAVSNFTGLSDRNSVANSPYISRDIRSDMPVLHFSPGTVEQASIAVYDAQGKQVHYLKKVFSPENTTAELSWDNAAPGVYAVRVVTESRFFAPLRFVISR